MVTQPHCYPKNVQLGVLSYSFSFFFQRMCFTMYTFKSAKYILNCTIIFKQVFINIHLNRSCLNKNIVHVQSFVIHVIGSTNKITHVYIFKIHGSILNAQILSKPLLTLHVPMCIWQHTLWFKIQQYKNLLIGDFFMIWRIIKDFSDIMFSEGFDYDIDAYYIHKCTYIPHAQICNKFITNVPHIHNIASQTMGIVYFETFQSFRVMNIVIKCKFN